MEYARLEGALKSEPGTYALVLRCATRTSVQVGRWGRLNVRRGYYVYVGSAFGPGGVLARVSRHCRLVKSKHWHFDYLRESGEIVSIWFHHGATRHEHEWASVLVKLEGSLPITGFGCSDCHCDSHLFFFSIEPRLSQFVRALGAPVLSCACPSKHDDH